MVSPSEAIDERIGDVERDIVLLVVGAAPKDRALGLRDAPDVRANVEGRAGQVG